MIRSGRFWRRSRHRARPSKTVVMFLSDHGMPLPFAKTQLYHHSTHTPLDCALARRDQSRRGRRAAHDLGRRYAADAARHRGHLSSDRDWTAARLRRCSKARTQADRDMVVKEYNENSGRLARSDAGDSDEAVPVYLQSLVERPADHADRHDGHADVSPVSRAGRKTIRAWRPGTSSISFASSKSCTTSSTIRIA